MVHISLVMMVKNETKRLMYSLNSVKDVVSSLIIFDTGSTDDTIDILKTFSTDNNIPLYLKTGEFVDFSTSRNVLLDFCNTIRTDTTNGTNVDYLLLLDCNDELRNGKQLITFCEKELTSDVEAFLIKQNWWSGELNEYYNVRLLRGDTKWRYVGVVHEHITCPGKDVPTYKAPSDITLYQDRTQDDDKTGKRFHRDRDLLLKEYEKDPQPRTTFYLAQTYECLHDNENSYKYYGIRSKQGNFMEEVFHSYLNRARLASLMGYDWEIIRENAWSAWDIKHRVEPLLILVKHYRKIEDWATSFYLIQIACSLTEPDTYLFLEKKDYIYKRWHLMGIIGWYSGHYEEGKMGATKAIEIYNLDIDKSNLKYYIDREKKMSKKNMIEKSKELVSTSSKLNKKKIKQRLRLQQLQQVQVQNS